MFLEISQLILNAKVDGTFLSHKIMGNVKKGRKVPKKHGYLTLKKVTGLLGVTARLK